MKKLTLNQLNLEVFQGETSGAMCDFCGECFGGMVKAAYPHKYTYFSQTSKKEAEASFWPYICFNCIKQLSKLIAK